MSKEKWEVKKLKDICDKGSSNVNMNSLKNISGDYPIYGASGFIQNVNFYHQRKEYIAIIKDGSGIGRTMLLPAKSSVIGTLQYILPKSGNSIRYIDYALQSLDLSKYKQGAAIPHIYFRDYGETEIIVPPYTEQLKIVKILDQKFTQLETIKSNAQKNLQNAKNLLKSEIKKLNTYKDYKNRKLDEVCVDIFAGGDKPKEFSEKETNKYNVPVYANAVTNDGLCGYTNKSVVNDKSVTISARGTIGFCCIRLHPYVPIVRLLVLIPNDNIDINYLAYSCRNLTIRNTGSSIPQLTVPMIKEYCIPIPPLSQQKLIVRHLNSISVKVNKLEEIYTKTIADCDELKQSFLSKAFAGEL